MSLKTSLDQLQRCSSNVKGCNDMLIDLFEMNTSGQPLLATRAVLATVGNFFACRDYPCHVLWWPTSGSSSRYFSGADAINKPLSELQVKIYDFFALRVLQAALRNGGFSGLSPLATAFQNGQLGVGSLRFLACLRMVLYMTPQASAICCFGQVQSQS